MRKLVLLACTAALIAASCTSATPQAQPTKSPTPAGPEHFTVAVDATPQTVSYNGSPVVVPLVADLFFPSSLSVHPGDVVTFVEQSSGEVHTVTLGTLIDQSAPALGPGGVLPSPSRGAPPPTGAAAVATQIPNIFPAGFPASRADAVASAAEPCFLNTGVPPPTGPCPQVGQPAFTGSQAFYNSGWLPPGSSFTVTVSATTPPGTYQFRDLAHPAMTGRLQVVPAAELVPPPSQVAATGAAQLQAAALAQAPAAAEAATVTSTVVAGITEVGVTGTFVAAFGPPTLTVTAGQSVGWNVYGDQALAIGPPPGAAGLLTRAANGTVHFNTTLINHAGGFAGPAGAPPRPETVNGGTYTNTGFHNSGLLVSVPPNLITYTLRFADPGTYTVQSLTYPSMTQTLNVVP